VGPAQGWTHNRYPVNSAFASVFGGKPAPGRAVGRIQIDSKDIVKKTFKLTIEGKNRDRVLDATKHEIRQYLKRERRKPLPEGVDFWDFDCQFGASADTAASVHLATITALIDAAAKDGADAFYIELIAKPGVRQARPEGDQAEHPE
jgi:hypothetical protein